jgi:hypothetical protein
MEDAYALLVKDRPQRPGNSNAKIAQLDKLLVHKIQPCVTVIQTKLRTLTVTANAQEPLRLGTQQPQSVNAQVNKL